MTKRSYHCKVAYSGLADAFVNAKSKEEAAILFNKGKDIEILYGTLLEADYEVTKITEGDIVK
jgi:hypothetical protein